MSRPNTENMPQDTLRSVVYRSFVHCDDPNGVVECGTIRKPKSGSRKMERQTQKEHWRVSNPSFVCKEERNEERNELVSQDITRELDIPLPSQLLEVSIGAQKINDMIDSWSKGLSIDGQSKDIARDLLKGALDLQESLNVLGKLQETSKYTSQWKKQKQKFEQGEVNELVVGRTYSDRYEFRNSPKHLQNPRHSADGSPRNCSEELKKLIRDSLSRQNFLPMHSTEEKDYWGRKKLDFDLDTPSTSSSRSALVPCKSPASFNSSVSSAAQKKKAKAPGLIAKLMGLEELPSEPIQSSKRIIESNKNSCLPRPIIDIEMPKPRKPQFVDSYMDPNQKTLKDIIETMHFKGLLKTKHVERRKFQSPLSDSSCIKQRTDDEIPPIVIIKPLTSSCVETEGPLLGKFIWDERALDPNNWLKFKEQTLPLTEVSTGDERGLELDQTERPGKKKREEEPATKMFIGEEGGLEHIEIPGKLETKKEPQTTRFIREEGAKNPKEKIRQLEAKKLETQGKASSYKVKSSILLNNEPKKKEDNKKSEKMEKVLSDRKRSQEKVKVKSESLSRSQDHAKATSSKLQKPDRIFTMVKNRLTQEESTTQNPKATCSTKRISQNSAKQVKREWAKKAKPIGGSIAIRRVIENSQHKHEDKETNSRCELDSTSTRTNTLPGDQHPTEEGTGVSEIHSEDWKTFHSEVTPLICQHENSIERVEEANQLSSHETTGQRTVGTEVGLKSLLLSSPSFLSCVEEFFDLNVNKAIALEKAGIEEVGMINSRILLECASELLARKSLRPSQVVVPLVWFPNPQNDNSLERLVEEVCNGVENLKRYSKGSGNLLAMDSLYLMLEKDLKGNGVVLTSLWDLGWKNGFSVNETGEVVAEVEKQLLDGLIEEFIIDILS